MMGQRQVNQAALVCLMQVRACRLDESLLNINNLLLRDTLIGEEWMALRQIASGAKAAAIPRSVRTRLEGLDLPVSVQG